MDVLTEKSTEPTDWHRLSPEKVGDRLQSSDNGLTLEEVRDDWSASARTNWSNQKRNRYS